MVVKDGDDLPWYKAKSHLKLNNAYNQKRTTSARRCQSLKVAKK